MSGCASMGRERERTKFFILSNKQLPMDSSVVLDWHKRPQRLRKQTLTYFDEFVANDPWYTEEMLADVPEEEMHAALHEENWSDDGVQDGEVDGAYSDPTSSSTDDATTDSEGEEEERSSEGDTGSTCSDGGSASSSGSESSSA